VFSFLYSRVILVSFKPERSEGGWVWVQGFDCWDGRVWECGFMSGEVVV